MCRRLHDYFFRFSDPYDWEEPTTTASIRKGLTYVSRSLSRIRSHTPASADMYNVLSRCNKISETAENLSFCFLLSIRAQF